MSCSAGVSVDHRIAIAGIATEDWLVPTCQVFAGSACHSISVSHDPPEQGQGMADL